MSNIIKGIKVFSGDTESIAKYDYESLENKPTSTHNLFKVFPNTEKDFFFKNGTTSEGKATVFAKLSTSKNAKEIVIDLQPNTKYDIKVKNYGPASSYRGKVLLYDVKFNKIKMLGINDSPDNVNVKLKKITVPNEILVDRDSGEGNGEINLVYENTKGYKTMIIFAGWGTTIKVDGTVYTITNDKKDLLLDPTIKISRENINPGANFGYEPWGGYTDPSKYQEQDMINFDNILTSNMSKVNDNTQKILEIAYNFWKHRSEFIYSGYTARDKPWDFWTKVGEKDELNTGLTVTEGNGGYKRIDCSTFVRYVTNGFDYYSTPYYNALDTTYVEQGALTNDGKDTSSTDVTICRSGKMYIRPNKKHIIESADSSKYSFTKICVFDRNDKFIKNLSTISANTIFTPTADMCYLRAEMKVQSVDNYAPAEKGVNPAGILKCLRIRENERLAVNAECPDSAKYANAMAQWFDNNGYGVEYNPYFWEDNDFKPGSIVFMGNLSATSQYKHITHITLYIGNGYIMHSTAPNGLVGGEGIMIHKLREPSRLNYTYPMADVVSPKYHKGDTQ